MAEARSQSPAARLLKTLVVAGAYLGGPGCGGQSRSVVEGPDTAGGGGTAGLGAAAGTGSASGGRAGEGTMAMAGYTGDIDGCPSSQRMCECSYQPTLIDPDCTFLHPFGWRERSPGGYALESMTCECDRSRPASPEACEHTQQFSCQYYGPEYEECTCNVFAPLIPDDCEEHHPFQCVGTDPLIGCECVTLIR